jgi:ornithine carbamoyltransferase
VNAEVMAATGNPSVKFMHCLPALHNRQTQVGQQLYERRGLAALKVTDEVFESCSGTARHYPCRRRGASMQEPTVHPRPRR